MENAVRIIGGKWRGRKLRFPTHDKLRPTLGRVRETLFNWLRADLQDATCLDLYAGTGALGFEAESLGAGAVTLVEPDRLVVKALHESVSIMASSAHIVQAKALDYLSAAHTPWNIVFLDPPFQSEELKLALAQLRVAHLVTDYVYYECPIKEVTPWPGWQVHRANKAGVTAYGLLTPEK